MSKSHPEYTLQKQACQWLNKNYAEILYLSDTIASVKLTMPQQARNKAVQKQGFKTPDLLIFEPKGKYKGLFVELKVKSPFKKNGELFKCEHLEGQQKTIDDLNAKGYKALFSWSYEMTIEIIENYLK